VYQRWYEAQLNKDGGVSRLDFDGLKRFGLAFPLAPAASGSSFLFFIPRAVRYLNIPTKVPWDAEVAAGMLELLSDALSDDEVALVFDLSLPLDNQLAVAAHCLKEDQDRRVKQGKITRDKIKPVRVSKDHLRYLRLLDAEFGGATDAEIGDALYSKLDNIDPDYQRTKRLSDDRKVAHELRDGGYRRLAAKKEGLAPARRRRRSTLVN
jgi:Uncharacterized conserved protein (DUF2285)